MLLKGYMGNNSYFIITTFIHIKKRREQCHEVLLGCFRQILGYNEGMNKFVAVLDSLHYDNADLMLTTCKELSELWP